jgi:hypothetical protein
MDTSSNDDGPPPLFREEQGFRQGWFWCIPTAILALMVILFGYGLYQQLLLGRPWGNNPLPNGWLLATSLFAILIPTLALVLLASARLVVEVRPEALRVRFAPFHRRPRTFDLAQIESAEARTYRPIVEYGGWGLRWSFGGRGSAYSVSGNKGVQLLLQDGRRLLIGSRRPEELARAIETARSGR